MATQALIGAAGSVELDPAIFEAPVKPHLFHAEVRRQLAARRAGTHSTKNRAAVSGGGIKPWKQKGTGRARQGTIRAPQWSGGGVVFGPVPRDYTHALPKKVRRAALCSALSLRQREGALLVAESLQVADGKTKTAVNTLGGLGLGPQQSVLVVLEKANPGVERALRNLPWVGVLLVAGLNTYDILRRKKLLLTRGSLDAIHARLSAAENES